MAQRLTAKQTISPKSIGGDVLIYHPDQRKVWLDLPETLTDSRKNKILLGVVGLSYIASGLWSTIPALSTISEGTKTILLTVVIAAFFSTVFPHKEAQDEK